MGREILYCSSCQTQLREADFQKDRAFRIQNRAYCAGCAKGQIASLTPEQMKALLRKVADPPTPASRAAAMTPRPVSSSKMPRALPRSGGSGPAVAIALGSAALVVLLWLALSGSRPAPTPIPRPVVVRPVPPPAPAPAPRPAEGPDLMPEIAAIDDQARPLLARESFKAAADLYELARGRHADAQWKALLEGKAAEARREGQRLFGSLKAQAAELRRAGKAEELKALRSRVASWGLDDLTAALESHLASIPEGRPWEPIFDGRTVECLTASDRANWHVENGAICRIPGNAGASAQSAGEWGDGEFRFRFENRGGTLLGFSVRQSEKGRTDVSFDRAEVDALDPATPHELIIRCRGENVTATLDGRPAKVTFDGKSLQGHLQFASDGAFRLLAIDFLPPR
jgi:hypothetical protein